MGTSMRLIAPADWPAAPGDWPMGTHRCAGSMRRAALGCLLVRRVVHLVMMRLDDFVDRLEKTLVEAVGYGELRQVFAFLLRKDDQPTEEAAIDEGADVATVVVKRPRANGLLGRFVGVGPGLTGADFVRPAAVGALGAERPRSVRVDAVSQSVQVKAVRSDVGVLDVDVKNVSGLRVDHGARHAPCVRRLVDVSGDQLVRFGHQEVRIEILAIDQGSQAPGVHFVDGDRPVLVAHVAHAVAAVHDRRRHMIVRLNR